MWLGFRVRRLRQHGLACGGLGSSRHSLTPASPASAAARLAARPAPDARAAALPAHQVAFRVLGFIPGSVGLRGRLVSVPETKGGPDNGDTAKASALGSGSGSAEGGHAGRRPLSRTTRPRRAAAAPGRPPPLLGAVPPWYPRGLATAVAAEHPCLPSRAFVRAAAEHPCLCCAQVFFDRPVLSIPGGIHIRIGPPSTVVLKTTFLDERVRVGKGSRGSLFVFTRGGRADQAGAPPAAAPPLRVPGQPSMPFCAHTHSPGHELRSCRLARAAPQGRLAACGSVGARHPTHPPTPTPPTPRASSQAWRAWA